MQEAIRQQRKWFLIIAVPGITTVLAFPFQAQRAAFMPHPRLPYNLLTFLAFLLSVQLLVSVWRVLFKPELVKERTKKLSRKKGGDLTSSYAGAVVGGMGSALATAPILYGYILALLSRETWRFLIFLPVAIVLGTVAWKKGRQTLESGGGVG